MSDYTVKFTNKDNYLEVKSTGTISGIKNMMEYSSLGIAEAFEKGYKKVFIDETEIKIVLSNYDQHELMNFFLNDFPKSIDLKFSTVYNPKNKELVDFFEDLSIRVGFDCKFFTTKDAALKNLNL